MTQQTHYAIIAYSPSLNEYQRWINLTEQFVYDPVYAQKLADVHAYTYNQQKKLNATDWVGQIQAQ